MVDVSTVMLALGVFRFGVSVGDYQTLRREAGYRWAVQERVGRDPASQFIGPGLQTITLSGVIYPHFKGGLRQVEFMRAIAGLGQPLMLTDGLGFVFDRWVILRAAETKTVLMSDGAPRKIDFEIELQSYGVDRA